VEEEVVGLWAAPEQVWRSGWFGAGIFFCSGMGFIFGFFNHSFMGFCGLGLTGAFSIGFGGSGGFISGLGASSIFGGSA